MNKDKDKYASVIERKYYDAIKTSDADKIYLEPGTKIKYASVNKEGESARGCDWKIGHVEDNFNHFINVRINCGPKGTYLESINKIDILCSDVVVKKVV